MTTPAPTNLAAQLKDEVASKLSELNPTIRERVVKVKTDEELDKRRDLVLKGLAKLEELQKSFAKIKPDHIIKDENDQIIQQGYTEGKLKDRKKAIDDIRKMEEALVKGLAEANYDPLKKVVGGGKDTPPEE